MVFFFNEDIFISFKSLDGAILRESRQDVADAFENIITDCISDYTKSSFTKEQIIIHNMPTIKKLWSFVHNEKQMKKPIRFMGRNRVVQSMVDLGIKPILDGAQNPLNWLERYIGKYFLMFLQGITIFSSEIDSRGNLKIASPAYHREASCGPSDGGQKYVEANLDCTGVANDSTELRRRRRNAWNCLIERKIYEKMYISLVQIADQDLGHRYHLRHVQQDVFETCYPLMYVAVGQVNVEFDGAIPVSVMISYEVRNTSHGSFSTVIEGYVRKFVGGTYDSDVACKRTEIGPDRVVAKYFKTQSFLSNPTDWVSQTIRRTSGGGQENVPFVVVRVSDPWLASKKERPNDLGEMAERCRGMLDLVPKDYEGAV